jgi:hypothetical protein
VGGIKTGALRRPIGTRRRQEGCKEYWHSKELLMVEEMGEMSVLSEPRGCRRTSGETN